MKTVLPYFLLGFWVSGIGVTEVSADGSSDPMVREHTLRLLAAFDTLFDGGSIPAEKLAGFLSRHQETRSPGRLPVSELVAGSETEAADLVVRRFLESYEGRVVERARVMDALVARLQQHQGNQRAKDKARSSAVMEFVKVGPGEVRWPGHDISYPKSFEVQTTPILWEHSDALRLPGGAIDRPAYLGAPVTFTLSEVPEVVAAVNASDPHYEYALMSQNQWLYLANSWGPGQFPPWGRDWRKLLRYAWMKENRHEAPHLPAPVMGRKPLVVDGQKIWGLFGNVRQIVRPSRVGMTRASGLGQVGGGTNTSTLAFDAWQIWLAYNNSDTGALRLVRRSRRPSGGRPR